MLAIAALSARSLAELAALDGEPCVALDLFGDLDTCHAAVAWWPIGEASALQIDGARLLETLTALARRDAVQGWVAGSGFEGDIDLLDVAARCLPLLGTAPADWRRVRDARGFFALLDEHGIEHPPVLFEPPQATAGWLLKDAGGCGGTHIVRASAAAATARCYWQRETAGRPMSATFVANGRDAVLLGINEQAVQAIGERPFVFAGVSGPVAVSEPVRQRIVAATLLLAREYRLQGLGSVDFLLEGERPLLLEVNPRPPASAALYPRLGDGGPMRAHRRACLYGELPAVPETTARCGMRTVFSRRRWRVDAAAAAMLAQWPGAHDLPREGTWFVPGDPVCSLSGDDLPQRAEALLQTLENFP